MPTIKVVRTITYEVEESGVAKLQFQLKNSLPVGKKLALPNGLSIEVGHLEGPSYSTDGDTWVKSPPTGMRLVPAGPKDEEYSSSEPGRLGDQTS